MDRSGWAQNAHQRASTVEEALGGQVDKVTHSDDTSLIPPLSWGFLNRPVYK